MNSKLFQGMRVLDFTTNVSGPTGTAFLADYGAEVIKVERPLRGDDNRTFPPMLEGQGTIGFWTNRGKRSIELNMNTPEGIETAKKLVSLCDVVAESYRPGIMKKFGLDYDSLKAIKPDIIYLSMPAYGNNGPYAKRPGYDLIAQAVSGQMELNGEEGGPAMKSGLTLGDYWGGVNAFAALATAWYHHKKTGEGQFVESALVGNLVYQNNAVLAANIGEYPTHHGNDSRDFAPYSLYSLNAREHVIICVTDDSMWSALCRLMGCEELAADARFAGNQCRLQHRAELRTLIEQWLKTQENAAAASAKIEAAGIPSCRVSDMNEAINDPHVQECGWVFDLGTPANVEKTRTFISRNVSADLSRTPGRAVPAPVLGADNYSILAEIGMSKEAVDQMMEPWKQVKA